MWTSAKAAFYEITVPLEDDIPHMYRDRLGYLTWGIGIKDDPGPTETTLSRNWIKCSGRLATVPEIRDEWSRIKHGPLYASQSEKIATMHLPQDDRDDAFWQVEAGMEKSVRAQFAAWDLWPADAQLALMSMAWNFGPAFKRPPAGPTGGWPDLAAHLDDQDWVYAAFNCEPGTGPNARSRQNKVLFLQAAHGDVWGLQNEVLGGPNPIVFAQQVQLAAANPDVRNHHGWWTQAMLADGGFYTLRLDGLFGPKSQAAWRAACQAYAVTSLYAPSSLARVSEKTLKVRTG
jgi:hypothetical protein